MYAAVRKRRAVSTNAEKLSTFPWPYKCSASADLSETRMEIYVMTAATISRMECRASERMPKLPVEIARKTFKETSTTAEPTEPSAAIRFSRDASSRDSGGIREIIRWEDGIIFVCGTDTVEFAASLNRGSHETPHRPRCLCIADFPACWCSRRSARENQPQQFGRRHFCQRVHHRSHLGTGSRTPEDHGCRQAVFSGIGIRGPKIRDLGCPAGCAGGHV